jgi:hypothetical protein
MKAILAKKSQPITQTHIAPKNTLWLKIEKEQQFSRTGKNAMGY